MNRGNINTSYTKNVEVKKNLKKLIAYIGAYKKHLIAVVFMAVISTVFMIAGPKVLANAIDELVKGVVNKVTNGAFNADIGYIGKILLIMLALYIFSSIVAFIESLVMAKVTSSIIYNLQNDVMAKINKLPLGYFNKNSYGDVLSRMTNDIDTLNMSLNQSFVTLISSIVTVVGVIAMMLSISVAMTLVAILTIPVMGIIVSIIMKKSQRYFKQQQEILGELSGQVEEGFSSHLVIKAFNREAIAEEKFKETSDRLCEVGVKSQFLSGLIMPIANTVTNFGYAIICIVGVVLAINGRITVGSIQAFLQYVRNFTGPINNLSSVANELQRTAAASERVFSLLAEEDDVDYESIKIAHEDGSVEFKNVAFAYDQTEGMIIKNFSMTAKSGTKTALVGPTGAGKTTLVKLLMGFHDINSGSIIIDGTDIHSYSREALRDKFAMVLQDAWLFSGTIMENIRYGRKDATDEEVIEAAKLSQADHFINTLPEGYETIIEEDADNISQGQKQLLTIARAMLKNSEMLILDEATSFVDTRTEIQIQKAMDKLIIGKTSFVIAHRISTIMDADNILVLKDGDIVEQGNHKELMKNKSHYYELYTKSTM